MIHEFLAEKASFGTFWDMFIPGPGDISRFVVGFTITATEMTLIGLVARVSPGTERFTNRRYTGNFRKRLRRSDGRS